MTPITFPRADVDCVEVADADPAIGIAGTAARQPPAESRSI